MSEWVIFGMLLVGLALTAYVFQHIETLSGAKLGFYLGSVVTGGVLGAVGFASYDYTASLGVILGVAMVALAGTVTRAVRSQSSRVIASVADRFTKERQPGYGADDDDDVPE